MVVSQLFAFFRLLFGAPLLFVYLLLWFCVWSCLYKQQIVIKIVATWKSLLDSDKQSFSPKAGWGDTEKFLCVPENNCKTRVSHPQERTGWQWVEEVSEQFRFSLIAPCGRARMKLFKCDTQKNTKFRQAEPPGNETKRRTKCLLPPLVSAEEHIWILI